MGWWEQFKEDGRHPVQDVKVDSERKGLTKFRKDPDLFGTYIVIEPDDRMCDLIAIQDWVNEHPDLTLKRMPVADIMSLASSAGSALVYIDDHGVVDYCGNASRKGYPGYRELTIELRPSVAWYKVAPKTIEVLGKRYDLEELQEALIKLEAK